MPRSPQPPDLHVRGINSATRLPGGQVSVAGKPATGARASARAQEYHLALAKSLARDERNETGGRTRRYFIRSEEALRRRSEIEFGTSMDLSASINPWASKLSAGMLFAALPLDAFGELSPKGVLALD